MRFLAPLIITFIGVALGCSSPRERLYTLAGPEPPAVVTHPMLHVVLGPVTIPAVVDRPQLVVRQSAVRLAVLEQERWAEPLREAVPRLLAETMSSQLRNASVSGPRTAAPPPDVRVRVEFTRFEAMPGQEVIIEARWWLRGADIKAGMEGTSVARVTVHGGRQDYDAVVAAAASGLDEIGIELSKAVEQAAVPRGGTL